MGGPITLTITRKGGEQHDLPIWTNMLYDCVLMPDVMSGDYDAISKVLETVAAAPANYAAKARDGMNPNFLADQLAAIPEAMAPHGYGLVVLDTLTRTLLSMQGYTTVERVHCPSIQYGATSLLNTAADGMRRRQDAFEAAGWVTGYDIALHSAVIPAARAAGFEVDKYQEVFVTPDRLSEIRTIIENHRAEPPGEIIRNHANNAEGLRAAVREFEDLQLRNIGKVTDPCLAAYARTDFGGTTVETFPETAEGARQMRQRLGELGFIYTPEEDNLWKKWIADKTAQENDAA